MGIAATTTAAYSDNAGIREATRDAGNPETTAAFTKDMGMVVGEIKTDSQYKAIPLNSKEDQDWFYTQAFLLWDKKISRSEFVKTGLGKFPGHEYEFNFLADRLAK